MDDLTTYKVVGLLKAEQTPKQIAEDLDVSYSAVLRIKRLTEEYKDSAKLREVLKLDMTEVVVSELAENLGSTEVEELTEAVNNLKGIQALEVLAQSTAVSILNKANNLSSGAQHMSELVELTDIVCLIQKTFFAQQPQINTQVNVGSGAQPQGDGSYAEYLSDTPKS